MVNNKPDPLAKGELSKSFARMRMRARLRALQNVKPEVACSKCGAHAWEEELDGVWYCFRCGNRGFYTQGKYRQGVILGCDDDE